LESLATTISHLRRWVHRLGLVLASFARGSRQRHWRGIVLESKQQKISWLRMERHFPLCDALSNLAQAAGQAFPLVLGRVSATPLFPTATRLRPRAHFSLKFSGVPPMGKMI
jgi:hypothetical protein